MLKRVGGGELSARRLQATLRFWRGFARFTRKPDALSSVFDMSQATQDLARPQDRAEVVSLVLATELGRTAIAKRPRLGRVDLDALLAKEKGTLGGAYARFMRGRGLDPNDIPSVDPENRGDDFDFVIAHLYETHDLWHVVTGYATDLPGELGLQAFYLAQQPSPLAATLVTSGLLGATGRMVRRSLATGVGPTAAVAEASTIIDAVSSGWQRGRVATGLIGRDWKTEWDRPLTDLRRDLCLHA